MSRMYLKFHPRDTLRIQDYIIFGWSRISLDSGSHIDMEGPLSVRRSVRGTYLSNKRSGHDVTLCTPSRWVKHFELMNSFVGMPDTAEVRHAMDSVIQRYQEYLRREASVADSMVSSYRERYSGMYRG